MAASKYQAVQARRELLVNARTRAPLASYSAITNDALKLWIERQKAQWSRTEDGSK